MRVRNILLFPFVHLAIFTATRDYEELRRRYHDVQSEYEKVSRRLDGATVQLDSLRKGTVF
jgi:hypothetical protein